MGTYINIGNAGFQRARNGEYIDKSGLIAVVNRSLFTERSFSCVSRARRFGKSMAAKMLCAYYDRSCDSRHLFEDLAIAQDPSFEKHLNQYPVIYLDMTDFVTRFRDETIVRRMDAFIRADIHEAYPDVPPYEDDDLMAYLVRVVAVTKEPFIFIIDEWDAICRELKKVASAMDGYVGWLRRMFKGVNASRVFAAVYMTGILPIKKYDTQSTLSNFIEYSMVNPGKMASFFGFTKEEVQTLSKKHLLDFSELEKWYDGYQIGPLLSMFNPDSVMRAIISGHCTRYWWGTSAYREIEELVQSNFDGVKDELIGMLGGNRYQLGWVIRFGRLSAIHRKDDIFLLLIHLGYLTYDYQSEECYFPNRETAQCADVQMLNGEYYDQQTKTHTCRIDHVSNASNRNV